MMSAARRPPQVFSIAAGAPFLPTLADAVLSGRLAPRQTDDPLALADVTILVPTRRAARALREVLLDQLGGQAVILPTIRPIGDVDEEDHLLNPGVEAPADRLALPPAISPLARLLALGRLTLEWGRTADRGRIAKAPEEPLLIPASAADALRLAGDLARLIDDLAIAGIGFEAIERLAADDQTGYFQVTLDFLKIVAEHWPRILVAMNRVDPAVRRDRLVRAEANRLEKLDPASPIIAAGSTGSIPATARLLKTIAHLPNGAVVLPGLDRFLDDAGFAAIGDPAEAKASAFGHPQLGLKKLIAEIGVTRADIEDLTVATGPAAARAMLLSEAMRPAATTDRWAGIAHEARAPEALESALAGVGLVVARNEQEEALAIALACREAVETSGAVAALVTPDRDLARRVAVELGRWGLVVDDSAGTPLDRLPPGIFARLLIELVGSESDPATLLALLKHPLAAFGLARPACRRAARALEVGLLRGSRVAGGVAALTPALAAARAKATDARARHVAAARRRLGADAWDQAEALLAAVASALAPLVDIFSGSREVPVAGLAEALRRSLAAAATDETGSDRELWSGEAGRALEALLHGVAGDDDGLTILPAEAPALLGTLMAGIAVTQPAGSDRRIHIWGTLEARLQSADLIVLGGLDEGVWPAETRTDAWLSRSMRAEIGLEPPERRIGLAAHDFAQGFAAPRVLVTRAEKRGGTPTVAARWLQRLSALIGDDATTALQERGERYLRIARRLDRVPPAEVAPSPRPAPRPPLPARPRSLSITEIETLIRDPYATYARHVLALEPLEPLGLAPDYALRGTIVHDALGRFTREWSGPYDAAAEARLLDIGRALLGQIAGFPDIHAIWSYRFAAIARWFVAWERARDEEIAGRFAEIGGGLEIAAPAGAFHLRGRADRIDLRKDGLLEILDFKTGAPPTARQLLTGLAPQLALEVAMARAGAFGEAFAGRSVLSLGWLALGQVARGDPYRTAVESRLTPDGLGAEALARLTALTAAYDDPDRGYVSRVRPMFETRFESPYDHLARVREWALVESGSDL
jgi:ATP-dependent helicase/nuclease subunit B